MSSTAKISKVRGCKITCDWLIKTVVQLINATAVTEFKSVSFLVQYMTFFVYHKFNPNIRMSLKHR